MVDPLGRRAAYVTEEVAAEAVMDAIFFLRPKGEQQEATKREGGREGYQICLIMPRRSRYILSFSYQHTTEPQSLDSPDSTSS